MTCHPAYYKPCGHDFWCACTRHWRHDAVQPVGNSPRDGETVSVHRAHLPVRESRVGSESPLRRLDRPEVGIGQGERVIVRDHYGFGPGVARGPVTLDNEGIWYVTFDSDYEDTFDYHLLERVYEL